MVTMLSASRLQKYNAVNQKVEEKTYVFFMMNPHAKIYCEKSSRIFHHKKASYFKNFVRGPLDNEKGRLFNSKQPLSFYFSFMKNIV